MHDDDAGEVRVGACGIVLGLSLAGNQHCTVHGWPDGPRVAPLLDFASNLALHVGDSTLRPGFGETFGWERDDGRWVAGVAGQHDAASTTRIQPAGLSTDGLDALQGNLVHHADPGELGFLAVE